jgi:hypothetical protein
VIGICPIIETVSKRRAHVAKINRNKRTGGGGKRTECGVAILVARLEDALGFDPFSAAEEAYFPVTLGDFIRVYEHAAKPAEATA